MRCPTKRRSSTLALVVLAVAATLSLPDLAQAQNTSLDQSTSAQLVGIVIDRQTSDPVPSARVNVVGAVDGVSAWSGIADEEGDIATAVTHYRAFLRFGTVAHPDLAPLVRSRLSEISSQ